MLKEDSPNGPADPAPDFTVEAQETVVRPAREIFPVADKVSDQPTLDLLTQRMQIHEKNAWMLRSLLEE